MSKFGGKLGEYSHSDVFFDDHRALQGNMLNKFNSQKSRMGPARIGGFDLLSLFKSNNKYVSARCLSRPVTAKPA